jgi:hypothetical protein
LWFPPQRYPWDFFPRHLSKKEFLDPYKALEKFASFRNIDQWKQVIRDLAIHALSEIPLNEFDDSNSILRTYIHLNKLIEATHLIEIRFQTRNTQTPPQMGDGQKRESKNTIGST